MEPTGQAEERRVEVEVAYQIEPIPAWPVLSVDVAHILLNTSADAR